MIRINLLPVRAAKKKESIRFQLTVGALVTAFVLTIIAVVFFMAASDASRLNSEIANGNAELEELKRKIGELSKIKEQKRIVEEKLKIITNLETARTGPSKLFEAISNSMPERAWINNWGDDGTILTLRGYAETDEVVADLMRGLARNGQWKVELEVAQRAVEPETGADVVSYIIRLEREKEKK